MTKKERKSRSKRSKKRKKETSEPEPLVKSVDTVIPEETTSPEEEQEYFKLLVDSEIGKPHEESIAEEVPEQTKPDNNGDETKKQHEEFEARFDSITLQYVQLAAVCRDLPEPVLAPTAKEYGERFYPTYSTAFQRIRKLLD